VEGKLIILSAPSGSGKSTLIQHLLKEGLPLEFSISATSRPARGTERDGIEYHFLQPEEFRDKITRNLFLEYEEVYPDQFYGTLKSEVEHKLKQGKNILFDVDVAGGLHIKQIYGDRALLIFIQPPSIEELQKRLEKRGTDSPAVIRSRIAKASYELSLANRYDAIIVNDNLETAQQEATKTINQFITNKLDNV
jgi:guanylate kinase